MRGQSSRWSGGRSTSGRGRGGRGARGGGLDDIPEENVAPAPVPPPAPAPARRRARGLPEGQRKLCTLDIGGHKLQPSGKVTRVMTRIFKQKWFIEGHLWKTLTDEQLYFYFSEFKKYYYWDDQHYSEVVIYQAWAKQACKRYQDKLYKLRSGEVDETVPEEILAAWNAEWAKEDFIARSRAASQNRLSAPPGQDGPCTHTGGSKDAVAHRDDLSKELGRPATFPELHVHLHTHKSDRSKFVDKKSKDVYELFQTQLAEAQASQQAEGQDNTINEDDIYMSLDPVKGYRPYGVGSASSSYRPSSSSRRRSNVYTQINEPSSSSRDEEYIKSVVDAEVEKKMEVYKRTQDEMQRQMRMFMQSMPAGFCPPQLQPQFQSQPEDDDEENEDDDDGDDDGDNDGDDGDDDEEDGDDDEEDRLPLQQLRHRR